MGSILKLFDNFIAEHGSASIMSKHRDFFRDKLQAAEKQIENLKRENTQLKEQLAQQESKLVANTSREEFVKHRNAAFKRKPEGGYHLSVYCPICHEPAGTIAPCFPFSCTPCDWATDITPSNLDSIIKELP